MRIGLEIEVSDKELLGRLANVKEKHNRYNMERLGTNVREIEKV